MILDEIFLRKKNMRSIKQLIRRRIGLKSYFNFQKNHRKRYLAQFCGRINAD